MPVRLSKSRLTAFRQCPKRLWLEVHRPELKVEDESAQRRFATGHQVGDLARSEYPKGVLIAPDNDLARAKAETKEEISSARRRPIFEATFETNGILVRCDLLLPSRRGWHMVEVKSSTTVKDYHIEDAAIQSWVVEGAGLKLAATSLQVIDSTWTYPGGGDYQGIFRVEPVDELIRDLRDQVPQWTAQAMAVASGPEPALAMGRHCNDPFECSFQHYCESLCEPVDMPISWIPNLHASKRAAFEAEGVVDIRQVDLTKLSERQREIAEAYRGGKAVKRPLSPAVRRQFEGTRYYLDFETVQFGVPLWAGTRPYQQVPFQLSCHVEKPGHAIRHLEFLDVTGDDPSRPFAETLLKAIGKSGPVIVYNASFESTRLKELAALFPDLAPALEAIRKRIVDLKPVTREHYFHPGLEGSWSIKNVLRTIRPDLDYGMLDEVGEGGEAVEAYLEAIDTATAANRKETLRQALLEYCKRDTEAMIHVLACLESASPVRGRRS